MPPATPTPIPGGGIPTMGGLPFDAPFGEPSLYWAVMGWFNDPLVGSLVIAMIVFTVGPFLLRQLYDLLGANEIETRTPAREKTARQKAITEHNIRAEVNTIDYQQHTEYSSQFEPDYTDDFRIAAETLRQEEERQAAEPEYTKANEQFEHEFKEAFY